MNTVSADMDNPSEAAAALDPLFAPFNRADAPGLVVAVARDGKPVYRRGFGLASVGLGVANTPWTRMRIGSTSKHFACLAALLLEEDGLLDLDAPASRHVPELVTQGAMPTLRQFMNHTSGLRCGLDAGFLAEGMAVRPAGSMLAGQVRMRDVNFAPGEKFMYNNGGYHLLSLAIARAAGMPFERFLAERILAPLGMHDTQSVPDDFAIHPGLATLHVPLPGGGYKRGVFPSMELLGEGAMISTLDDMLRWLAHLRGPKRVGSAAAWERMTAPTRLANGVAVPYGYGLMRHPYRGVEVIHHAGAVIGGACQMLTVPAHALDIVIMSNGAPVNPHELAMQVLDKMLGDALAGPVPAKADSTPYRRLIGARYVGRASGLVIGFADVEGALGLSLLNLPPMPLYGSGGELRLPFEDIAAGPFVLDARALEGEGAPPATLPFGEAGVPEPYDLLVAPEGGLPPFAAALAGEYTVPDLDARATIAQEGEDLTMRVQGRFGATVLRFEPFGPGLLGWRMDGADIPLRGIAHVRRDGNGVVTELAIDTTRTRGMRFMRQGR
ncbi:serine hydrolase domain-containing protein [Pseudoduganella umbonata]|uniref:Beta-lactamase family protein n=1 Tax=Pseudoduganella umbonata TaxID=864828 RepID=A0A4P8HM69_9BURK|nr:serine hydrolase domain-containing protein [Pseudoduganella umbonata]MBB3222684.1 CubicO group peptidase (beta-lactamase class C family) [Pseudoduganella umbonata]QCP10813.1 beta-lactamase family protein [Pseudoduganella umbonata]